MTTHYTDDPSEAAVYLRRGELVAFPTETVYGLGADVFNEEAVRRIYDAKGRPGDNPLIAHIAALSHMDFLVSEVTRPAELLVRAFFPGPLTLVLPRRAEVPDVATGSLSTIGVRMPRHETALAFLRAAGTPVVAPSANLSGRPSPTSWEAVAADLDGRIACILKGERTEAGLESTVVDCTGGVPAVLRPGAVTIEELRTVIPGILSAESEPHLLRRSPGTRYRHYAPAARVVLVPQGASARDGEKAAYIGVTAPAPSARFCVARVCADLAEYAHELFAFFREADAAGAGIIYCEGVEPVGLGTALMDRLTRAAKG